MEEAGIEIPDELLSIRLLGSLPTEFENFSVAIEFRDNIPTLENLKIKLIEEETRQNNRVAKTDDDNNNDALLTKGCSERSKRPYDKSKNSLQLVKPSKFVGKCYNCRKTDHMSRQCRARPSVASQAKRAMR